jgi:quinol monooxygenase YgiN
LIHVIAHIELQPGTRDRFLREFAKLQPEVHAEAGCIEYAAAVDLKAGVPGQVPVRPNTVIIVEKWSSLEALGKHAMAPHMWAYRERVKDVVIRTVLQVLEPAGEEQA